MIMDEQSFVRTDLDPQALNRQWKFLQAPDVIHEQLFSYVLPTHVGGFSARLKS